MSTELLLEACTPNRSCAAYSCITVCVLLLITMISQCQLPSLNSFTSLREREDIHKVIHNDTCLSASTLHSEQATIHPYSIPNQNYSSFLNNSNSKEGGAITSNNTIKMRKKMEGKVEKQDLDQNITDINGSSYSDKFNDSKNAHHELIFISPLQMNWDGSDSKQFKLRRNEICKIMYINYNLDILQHTTYITTVSPKAKHFGHTYAKFIGIYDELNRINAMHSDIQKRNLVVMVYDGFDVYFQVNYDLILDKYLALSDEHNLTNSILINTEKNCAITGELNNKYKQSTCNTLEILAGIKGVKDKKYDPYLNTGVMVATFETLFRVFTDIHDNFLPVFLTNFTYSKHPPQIGDQTLFIMYFIYLYEQQQDISVIFPDYYNEFTQTFHKQVVNFKKHKTELPFLFRYLNQDLLLFNTITETYPYTLHYNGQGRYIMMDHMNYKIQQNTEVFSMWNETNFTYHTDNGDIKWKKLCSYNPK